jgi:pimeloyl-ACP methyl ester carboxylesterase
VETLLYTVLKQPIRVLAWGPESAAAERTVVLLHGYMDAAGSWDLVAPVLANAGFRIYAPDLRGYGHGVRVEPASTYHFPDYVLDLAELLDHLPQKQVCLVGHSMGGVVASLYSGAFPERVSHLALLEGVGPDDNVPGTVASRMRAFVDQTRKAIHSGQRPALSFEEALRRMRVQHAHIPEAVLRTRVPHLIRAASLASENEKDELAEAQGHMGESESCEWLYDPRHKARSATPFFASSYREFAASVTCPVLFVSGGSTGYHPADESERLQSFRDLTRASIEDAGHMMHWTKPQALAEMLLRFLRAGADVAE